jgi:hypothetical protein
MLYCTVSCQLELVPEQVSETESILTLGWLVHEHLLSWICCQKCNLIILF